MVNWIKTKWQKLPQPLQVFLAAFGGLNTLVWSFTPAVYLLNPPLFLFTVIFWVSVCIAITAYIEGRKDG